MPQRQVSCHTSWNAPGPFCFRQCERYTHGVGDCRVMDENTVSLVPIQACSHWGRIVRRRPQHGEGSLFSQFTFGAHLPKWGRVKPARDLIGRISSEQNINTILDCEIEHDLHQDLDFDINSNIGIEKSQTHKGHRRGIKRSVAAMRSSRSSNGIPLPQSDARPLTARGSPITPPNSRSGRSPITPEGLLPRATSTVTRTRPPFPPNPSHLATNPSDPRVPRGGSSHPGQASRSRSGVRKVRDIPRSANVASSHYPLRGHATTTNVLRPVGGSSLAAQASREQWPL